MANTINEIHNAITVRAAEIANADTTKHPQFVFRPLSVASKITQRGIDGLCLSWDPEYGLRNFTFKEREEITTLMNGIGQRAIRQAIIENKESFVGLIVGEARLGKNYFEHYQR